MCLLKNGSKSIFSRFFVVFFRFKLCFPKPGNTPKTGPRRHASLWCLLAQKKLNLNFLAQHRLPPWNSQLWGLGRPLDVDFASLCHWCFRDLTFSKSFWWLALFVFVVRGGKYNPLSIQVCPKEGISPTILFWGWDWDHQSYSREGSGFLGILKRGSLVVWLVRVGVVCFWSVNALVVWDGHFSSWNITI